MGDAMFFTVWHIMGDQRRRVDIIQSTSAPVVYTQYTDNLRHGLYPFLPRKGVLAIEPSTTTEITWYNNFWQEMALSEIDVDPRNSVRAAKLRMVLRMRLWGGYWMEKKS